jgi:predicted RNA-binding Zn-ribbon protein involved in translation (DUF1610 family)
MFHVTQRKQSPDNTGCAHSNNDGPVGKLGDREEFRCPKCGKMIERQLDGSGRTIGSWIITYDGA